MAVDLTNYAPPRCRKHNDTVMILSFYDPGNRWVCSQCIEKRKSLAEGSLKYAKTRFPEGAEL